MRVLRQTFLNEIWPLGRFMHLKSKETKWNNKQQNNNHWPTVLVYTKHRTSEYTVQCHSFQHQYANELAGGRGEIEFGRTGRFIYGRIAQWNLMQMFRNEIILEIRFMKYERIAHNSHNSFNSAKGSLRDFECE